MEVPLLANRATLNWELTLFERDVLLYACVDMVIGQRPYISAMN